MSKSRRNGRNRNRPPFNNFTTARDAQPAPVPPHLMPGCRLLLPPATEDGHTFPAVWLFRVRDADEPTEAVPCLLQSEDGPDLVLVVRAGAEVEGIAHVLRRVVTRGVKRQAAHVLFPDAADAPDEGA